MTVVSFDSIQLGNKRKWVLVFGCEKQKKEEKVKIARRKREEVIPIARRRPTSCQEERERERERE